MLDELVRRITASVTPITDEYEIILVNDQSPDDSWNVIKRICKEDKHVKGVNLSRNFGQHYAITAGLSKSSGEWVVVMDCDLQDRPEEIPNLYHKAMEGFDSSSLNSLAIPLSFSKIEFISIILLGSRSMYVLEYFPLI